MELDDQIKKAIESIRSMRLADQHLQRLEKVLWDDSLRLSMLEKTIEQKIQKVDGMKSYSAETLFHKILGRHEEQLEIIKEKYLELVLEYNERKKAMDVLQFEIDVLKDKVKNMEAAQQQLDQLLIKRERELRDNEMREYITVLKKIDFKIGLIKEIEEAIKAGNKLVRQYRKAIKYLKDKSESLKDLKMEMKNIIHFKVMNIDKIQDMAISIRQGLYKFEDEINDVYNQLMSSQIFKLDMAKNFSQEYREKLITDWQLDLNLYSAHQYLELSLTTIQGMLTSLKKDLKKLRRELKKLEKEREGFRAQL